MSESGKDAGAPRGGAGIGLGRLGSVGRPAGWTRALRGLCAGAGDGIGGRLALAAHVVVRGYDAAGD